MITLGGFTYTGINGVAEISEIEPRIQVSSFPGVQGVSTLVSPPGAARISCQYTMQGFSSKAELTAAVKSLMTNTGATGDLTFSDPFADFFAGCTYEGFRPEGHPFWDGALVFGWIQRGRLTWIWRNPSA